jgi:sporulation protein YlmC with PRC-barrel domain
MKRNLILTSAVLLALSVGAGAAEDTQDCREKAAALEQQVQNSTKTEAEKASMTASLNDAKSSDLAGCEQVVGRIERELSAIPEDSSSPDSYSSPSSATEPASGSKDPADAGTSGGAYEPGHASAEASMPTHPGADANDSADMGVSQTGEPQEGYASPQATSPTSGSSDPYAQGSNEPAAQTSMQTDSQMGAGEPGADAGSKLAAMSAADLEEKPVVNAAGEEIGEIEKVVTDNSPQAKGYAVIEYGGVLGLGEKQVLVDLDQLTVSESGNIQVPAAEADDFDAYPEYVETDYTEYDGSLARLL